MRNAYDNVKEKSRIQVCPLFKYIKASIERAYKEYAGMLKFNIHNLGCPQAPSKDPDLSHFWCLPCPGFMRVCELGGGGHLRAEPSPPPDHVSHELHLPCRPLCLYFVGRYRYQFGGFPNPCEIFFPNVKRCNTVKCLTKFLSIGEMMISNVFLNTFLSLSFKKPG